jgi:iron complex transport system substrate-binding protein
MKLTSAAHRRSAWVASLIGVSLSLVACGSGSGDAPTAKAVHANHGAAIQGVNPALNLDQCGKDVRTIKHEAGTTKITGTPKRVVVLELSFIDAAVNAGINPIGIADDDDPSRILPALRNKIGKYTSVGLRATPNLQVILALKPDLIIADSERQKGIYAQLSKIAPTVEFPSLNANYQQTLDSELLAAVALNRCDPMKARLARHAAFMKNIKAAVPTGEHRKAMFAVGTDTIFVAFTDAYFTDNVLSSVGIPSALDGKNGVANVEMNLETVSSSKPDILFIARVPGVKSIDQGWASNPLWKAIPAVKDKSVYPVDQNAWSRSRGIEAAELIATQAVKFLYGVTVTQ